MTKIERKLQPELHYARAQNKKGKGARTLRQLKRDLQTLVYEESMGQRSYVENRLIPNIQFFNALKDRLRKRHRILLFTTICAGALLPILLNLEVVDVARRNYLGTGLSIMMLILVSMEHVFQYKDRTRHAKMMEARLRRELFVFMSGTEPYEYCSEDQGYKLLVTRVESIIDEERDDTRERITADVKRQFSPEFDYSKSLNGIR